MNQQPPALATLPAVTPVVTPPESAAPEPDSEPAAPETAPDPPEPELVAEDSSSPAVDPLTWTDIQDILILGLKEKSKTWREIAAAIEGRDTEDCRERYDALMRANAEAEENTKKEAEEAIAKEAAEEIAAKEAAEAAAKLAAGEEDAQTKKEAEEAAAKKKQEEEAAKKNAEESKEAGGEENDSESANKDEGKWKKSKKGKSKSGRKEGKKFKGRGKATNTPPGDPLTDPATADNASFNDLSMQDVRPFPFFLFARNLKENVKLG